MKKLITMILFITVLYSNTLSAAPKNESGPVVVIPKTKLIPVIDGDDKDACWSKALKLTSLVKFNPSGMIEPAATPNTEVKIMAGKNGIYVYAVFSEPEINRMSIKGNLSNSKSYSSQIWLEDHWEIFIKTLGAKVEIQLMGDPKNRGTERKGKKESKITGMLATKIKDKSWTMEMFIPAKSLDANFADSPAFRFNFYRVRRTSAVELSCWTPVQKRFSDLDRFGWLIFSSADKNIKWLSQKFVKKEQKAQLAEIKKIFTKLNIKGKQHKVFIDICDEITVLEKTFQKIPAERWEKIAAKAEKLPERLRKLWETAKLMEIIR